MSHSPALQRGRERRQKHLNHLAASARGSRSALAVLGLPLHGPPGGVQLLNDRCQENFVPHAFSMPHLDLLRTQLNSFRHSCLLHHRVLRPWRAQWFNTTRMKPTTRTVGDENKAAVESTKHRTHLQRMTGAKNCVIRRTIGIHTTSTTTSATQASCRVAHPPAEDALLLDP